MYSAPALILIDVQEGFNEPYWGTRNNPCFEENISQLLRFWRKREFPIFHVQHLSVEASSPLRPDGPGVKFMAVAWPEEGERVISKNVNSAFIGTSLEEQLRKTQIQQLVIAGLTTDHCVSTSVRMARNLGFQVTIPHDASACFDRYLFDGVRYDAETVHRVSLASLNREFATLKTTKELLQTT